MNINKLILLLITITTFINISHASFPIMGYNTSWVLYTTNFENPDDDEMEVPLFVAALTAT